MGISVHFRDESVAKGSLKKSTRTSLSHGITWNENKFNKVSPDHSLEWLNGIGIRSGRIVGITSRSLVFSRWAPSYNLRSQRAEHTHTMFRLRQEDKFSHDESTSSGRKDRDNKDE